MRTIDGDRLKFVLQKNFGGLAGAEVMQQLIDEQPTLDVITPEIRGIIDGYNDLIANRKLCEHWPGDSKAFHVPLIEQNITFIKAVASLLIEHENQSMVHAHWVHFPGSAEPFCSKCRVGAALLENGEYLESEFCPYCGAIMDEERSIQK